MAMRKDSPNDYASLAPGFAESCEQVIDSLDSKGPGKILFTSAYLASRAGIVCETEANGTLKITFTKKETDQNGRQVKQAFTIGARTEANTLAREIRSASLKVRRMPKHFMTRSKVDQLLLDVTPAAQKGGDTIQSKMDRENYKIYPLFFEDPTKASFDMDPELDPDLSLISDLTSHAYGIVAQDLGDKVAELKVMFVKLTDTTVVADSFGTQADTMMPRAGIMIQVKTVKGSEAFGAIRGSSGTIIEILSRNVPHVNDLPIETLARNSKLVSVDPFDIVAILGQRVAKEAINLDRAEGSSILGRECHVIFSSQTSGVFVHEMLGHPAEADIICDNSRNATAKIRLLGRFGGRVSGHKNFNVIETPEPHFKLGTKEIKFSWGAMPGVDEYGVVCKPVTLIENGVNVGALTNHYTLEEVASGIDEKLGERMRKAGLSGRSRSEAFDKIPQVRMTTTVIMPCDSGEGNPKDKEYPEGRPLKSVHEMAALIPKNMKGIYVKTISGGWVNPDDGTFMLNGGLCFLIENGLITDKPIKDVKLQGNITTFQDKIIGIGTTETAKYPFTGFCGKSSQWVPVESIGPALLLQKVSIAGGSTPAWQRVVAEYDEEHMKVLQGKQLRSRIHVPEIADDMKRMGADSTQSQENICLVTASLGALGEKEYILGERVDTTTHELSSNDDRKLIKRSDVYDR